MLLHGSRVLLCKDRTNEYFYLPGGHVEPWESSEAAVSREFIEECGLPVRTRNCLVVHESFFQQKGKTKHEITTVFHVEHEPDRGGEADDETAHETADADSALDSVRSQEERLEFQWVELAALVDLDIRPLEQKAWLIEAPGLDAPTRWISSQGR